MSVGVCYPAGMIKLWFIIFPLSLTGCASGPLTLESEQFMLLESSDPRQTKIENKDYRLVVEVKSIDSDIMIFQVEIFNKNTRENIVLRPQQIQLIGDAWDHRPQILTQDAKLRSLTQKENELDIQDGIALAGDVLLFAATIVNIINDRPSNLVLLDHFDSGYAAREFQRETIRVQKQYVTNSYLTTTSILPLTSTRGDLECRGNFSRGDFALLIPINDEVQYLRYRIH
ncbi:MAG: hypothetical protein K2Q26_02140 [Bdellovibrionales bacterium]|nr:hypothetical protein [Bdellovibrionales bacterium]